MTTTETKDALRETLTGPTRKPRRTLTVADRLRELDDRYVAQKVRDDKRVAKADAALEGAKAERQANAVAYAEKRRNIVNDALAKADGRTA